MKRKCIAVYVLMIAFLAVTAGCATAQTDKAVKNESSAHESHTEHDPLKSSPPSDADKAQPADQDMKNMQMMQEHLKKMDSRMEKIRSAADPQEHRKLMQEHMADMKEGMKMMNAMPGCKMMSGGNMMKEGHGMGMENMIKCHQKMEMRTKMMQSILEGALESSQTKHESHPSGNAAKSFQAEMFVPSEIRQEQIFPITILIKDEKGRNVTQFETFQEKLMHLIIVSDDLGFFRHLHPDYKGNGSFLTETVFPDAGAYTLFSDYKPENSGEQLSALKLRIKGTVRPPAVPDTKKTEKIVGDVKISMDFSPKTVKTNEETIVAFDLKMASDDSPVKDLQPFLGEKAHLVVIRKSEILNTNDYVHAHAIKEGEPSSIKFMTKFPSAGVYKLWCQFNYKNEVVTADFWINAE